MTGILVLLGGIGLLAVPTVACRSMMLTGRAAARFAAATLLAGFACIIGGLALVAAPALLGLTHVDVVADICVRAFAPLITSDVLGWFAAGLVLVVLMRAARAGWRAHKIGRGAAAEPWWGEHVDCGDYEVVFLPTDHVLALSVPTSKPQVLLSDGLVRHLDSDQLDVVLRHEAAHLRAQHWRFMAFAAAVERALRPLPFVSSSVAVLRHSLEVWADDDAADSVPQRRAQLQSALRAVAGADPRGLGVGALDRIRRLIGSPPKHSHANRVLHGCPVLVVVGIVLLATLGGAGGVHHVAAAAGYWFH